MMWILFSILSALLLSITEIFTKKILTKEHSYEYLIGMLIVSVVLGSPFLLGVSSAIKPHLWLLLLKGIIYGLACFLMLKATRHLELSEAAPLKNLTPLFLILLAPLILQENIPTLAVIGIVFIVGGAYWIEWILHGNKDILDFRFLQQHYILMMIGGVFLLSLCPIIDKVLIPRVGWQITWVMGNIFALLFMALFFMVQNRNFSQIIPKFKKNNKLIIGSGIVSVISTYLYFMAMIIPGTSVALILTVKRLSTMFTVIGSGAIFHDHRMKEKIFACSLMIIGTAIIALVAL